MYTILVQASNNRASYYAFPQSGPMDFKSYKMANLVVGNPVQSPALECTGTAPTIRFNTQATLAVSGADMQWTINGKTIPMHTSIHCKKDDILSGKNTIYGFRSYIAIRGNSLESMVSKHAVYPTPIKPKEILSWQDSETSHPHVSLHPITIKKTISFLAGPEYSFLDLNSQSVFSTEEYEITSKSNRIGARLDGPILRATKQLVTSRPIIPGIIQLPPDGKPIVCLQDCQTTGGYPRIGFITREQLDYFNQIPHRQKVMFKHID